MSIIETLWREFLKDRKEFLEWQREDMCIAHPINSRRTWCPKNRWSSRQKQYRLDAPCICGRAWREWLLTQPGTIIRFAPVEAGNFADPCTLNVNGYRKKIIKRG